MMTDCLTLNNWEIRQYVDEFNTLINKYYVTTTEPIYGTYITNGYIYNNLKVEILADKTGLHIKLYEGSRQVVKCRKTKSYSIKAKNGIGNIYDLGIGPYYLCDDEFTFYGSEDIKKLFKFGGIVTFSIHENWGNKKYLFEVNCTDFMEKFDVVYEHADDRPNIEWNIIAFLLPMLGLFISLWTTKTKPYFTKAVKNATFFGFGIRILLAFLIELSS